MQILRKISGKTVLGGPVEIRKLVDSKVNKKTPVYNVYGIARSTKQGETDNGPWTALVGSFEVEALAGPNRGEVFQAPVLHLPKPMDEMFHSQLQDEETDSIQFALQIGLEFDEAAATGYIYTTKPLVETSAADPLADLRGKVKQLAAPKK